MHSIVLVVLYCVQIVTAEETDRHEATAGSFIANLLKSASSSLMAICHENKAALLCTAVVIMVAFIYFLFSVHQPVGPLQQNEEEESIEEVPATGSEAQEVYEQPVAVVQQDEAAAIAYAAQRDHKQAACLFVKAAQYYSDKAGVLQDQDDDLGAANDFVKAAALYKAATDQALAAGPSDGGGDGDGDGNGMIGKYKEQYAMHLMAGLCYGGVAEQYAADENNEQARVMNLAAAKQHEASIECARAFGDNDAVSRANSFAAERHAAAGDMDRARLMKGVAADGFAAHGAQLSRGGDRLGAVSAFRSAAREYEGAGQRGKAHSMNALVAKLYEESDGQSSVHEDSWYAARYYHDVADAYMALGQIEKAKPMIRKTAEKYREEGQKQEKSGRKAKASVCYGDEARLYRLLETMGDA